MLAQSFLKPETLGLSDEQHAALVKVLGMLERGEIEYYRARFPDEQSCTIGSSRSSPSKFNMVSFYRAEECGTVSCICGWAEHVGGLPRRSLSSMRIWNPQLGLLFEPPVLNFGAQGILDIQPDQAAVALRNYLTTGHAMWQEILV